jgi:hypothetical protein
MFSKMKYYERMVFVGYFEAVEVVLVVFIPLADNSQSDDCVDTFGIQREYPFEDGLCYSVVAKMKVAVSHS